MRNIIPILTFFWLLNFTVSGQRIDFSTLERDSVTDVDGNTYPTILFDDTWWMATNLRTKHYNDGTEILQMTKLMDEDDEENDWNWWAGADRWGYVNLDSSTFNTYGLLYSWSAAMNTSHGGICPKGWVLTDTGDWDEMARLIVDESNLVYEYGTRPTPDGGTEGFYEVVQINQLGRYLKSDNGILWKLTPTISWTCNQSEMNIVPTGKLNTRIEGLSELADFWTSNYVHADSSGQGRRYYNFTYSDHNIYPSRNHNANLQCVRCVKAANVLNVSTNSISLDSLVNSSATVHVTANCSWLAQTNATWLNVMQDNNSGDGIITIMAISANTAYEARTDTVFIKTDNLKTKMILVTQAGKETLFSVSAESMNIMAAEGSTGSFSISSTVVWTVTSSEPWLIPNITSGSGNSTIILTASANTKDITRSAIVTIESETAATYYEIVVTQTQHQNTAIYNANKAEMLIFPNPANDFITISYPLSLSWKLITINGLILKSGKTTGVKETISLTGLKPGLYFIQINNRVYKLLKN
jgi:uncharacterized protein (TIGR02145 family)